MLCPKCGKEVNQDDVICLNCGNLLTSTYRPIISNDEDGTTESQNTNMPNNTGVINETQVSNNIPSSTPNFNNGNNQISNENILNNGINERNVLVDTQANLISNNQNINDYSTNVINSNFNTQPSMMSYNQNPSSITPSIDTTGNQMAPNNNILNGNQVIDLSSNIEDINTSASNDLKFDSDYNMVNPINESGFIDIDEAIKPEEMAYREMNNLNNEVTKDEVISNGYVSSNTLNSNPDFTDIVASNQNNNITSISYIDQTNNNGLASNNISMPTNSNNIDNSNIIGTPIINNSSENPVPTVVPNNVENIETTNNSKAKIEKPKKERKNNSNLLVIIVAIVVLALVALGIYYFISNKSPKKYSINGDEFPSITSIVGNRKLSSSSHKHDNETYTQVYHYTNVKNVTADLAQYVQTLIQSLNYINNKAYDLNEDSGTIELGNESKTEGYVIQVIIEYSFNEYTITINKVPGTLTRY